ncbi:CtsR family transcriptional regulator [Alicyclobacillus acidocaldarius]|uniref:Transcriptional regulator CtsR n=1 Tax=Alicyclobacillus acidocaldarius subsp. acidocaldarius (strain ATCC 27009 / DSM 446 / BCRC 14685 / JCM 5260 / KCTC 1825 / NBRC 15652 / NCIMB 11725 / NRRL B-14509 / 104-IA) TaxID=521098 RepID=C8WU05_ALIAD|nr:CtsR family transcriptional regulator [Alicyclobacillus acidocaldarius]ACV59747.1 transcriptional repressor, CtsR [Alicyclobacillus acidocaldarius subsp. acidocaldarius DSM 446]
MASNISDIIEAYLKRLMEESGLDVIEIQRNELAEQFHCVPSQINYVISTRFTTDHGYIVESKRGGGGYIRIRRVKLDKDHLLWDVLRSLGDEVSQSASEALIERLHRDGWLTDREAALISAMLRREVLALGLPYRDRLRAKLLASALQALAAHRKP